MITNKYISKIVIGIMAVAVLLCFLAMAYADRLNERLGGQTVKQKYETELFNTDEVISIDIKMDADEWEKMLSNAMSEEYYACDVVINGETVKNVGIRPKGNTSLSAIAMNSETNRYSLKLEFDQFEEGQTCYGLDKLILNNNYADATNMKEAVIYDMFQYLGADASLYNYAKVSVNGEYKGVYLALEAVEESFLLRNFGTQNGNLYKPDSMEMGGGDKKSGDRPSGFPKPGDMPEGADFDFGKNGPPGGGDFGEGGPPDFGGGNPPDGADFGKNGPPGGGDFDPSNMPQRPGSDEEGKPDGEGGPGGGMPEGGPGEGGPGKGGFPMGGNGSNLNYTDDDLDSYSTIWDGDILGSGTADKRRVVEAIKNVNSGNELEKYLDVDNILKYMAVHTFSVNMDSLSGSMAHNYYLYETNGQLNIFPWDYNLSLGGMSMGRSGGATEMVNDAMDTPFDGTDFFNALLENETYLEKYHDYLRQLVEEYVNGGRFDEVYQRIRGQIDTLVETDPTAFYNYDEYNAAAEMLCKVVKLRAESISGQLDGTIPSTDEGQKQDSSNLVDASDIDVKVMGEFDMGGKGGPGEHNGDKDGKDGKDNKGDKGSKDSEDGKGEEGDN
ncbi:MAG: CotH kinase family protein [Butyrivibrio sp.]|nr:CotH kinase family protein [Butyrivibrio sp.]